LVCKNLETAQIPTIPQSAFDGVRSPTGGGEWNRPDIPT
jgi:hypothetical protein